MYEEIITEARVLYEIGETSLQNSYVIRCEMLKDIDAKHENAFSKHVRSLRL